MTPSTQADKLIEEHKFWSKSKDTCSLDNIWRVESNAKTLAEAYEELKSWSKRYENSLGDTPKEITELRIFIEAELKKLKKSGLI